MRRVLAGVLALAPVAAAAQDAVQFQSPTGNIHCYMFAGDGDWWGARCDILEATRSFPQAPADCDLDWGHAFEVPSRGRAAPVCAGDTVAMPGSPVLGYGQSVSLGGVLCTSERSGMTCQNREGRGFTLSRARQAVF
ncbi:MAG: hypothetical protein KF887_11465 [Paracoccaceae bacterium]|nr:MAG: hypothetical protein KF887_11465 [Paracoccaceae bacterium]